MTSLTRLCGVPLLRFLFWWSIPKKLSRYKLTSSPSGQLGVSRSDLCVMLFHNKGRDLLNQKVSHALISKRVIIFMATLRRYKLSPAWMFRRSIWSRKTSLSLGNTVLRSVVRDRGFGTKHKHKHSNWEKGWRGERKPNDSEISDSHPLLR